MRFRLFPPPRRSRLLQDRQSLGLVITQTAAGEEGLWTKPPSLSNWAAASNLRTAYQWQSQQPATKIMKT
jgi:hypothetical protein